MEELKRKAISFGATEFGKSKAKNKRFYVIYNGKRINFGLLGGQTFIDHNDKNKQRAWKARHSKIKLKDGRFAYQVKEQPEYWAYHLLW
jgi:hypothetical protein